MDLNEAAEQFAPTLENIGVLGGFNKLINEAKQFGFKAGAEWQKEQDKELIEALKQIAAWPGNLPDERYTSRTGANDAALRGGMVVAMRQIALSALKKLNHDTNT